MLSPIPVSTVTVTIRTSDGSPRAHPGTGSRFSMIVNKSGRGWMDSHRRRRAADNVLARSMIHGTVGGIHLREGEAQGATRESATRLIETLASLYLRRWRCSCYAECESQPN